MTFDYLNLKLPESKKTGLHTLTLQMKMDKVLFMLHLYPDFELAGAVGGVGNIHSFLPFHFGKEIYDEMKEDVSERRKNKDLTAMIGLWTDVYELWLEDYDINQFYNMITGKREMEEEVIGKKEIKEKFYRENELEPSRTLTFSNVIAQMEMHVILQAKLQSPNVAPGKWWVIYYNNLKIKGKFAPFVLMARINDDGRICYLQGVWPFEYLMNALAKILPIGYEAKEDKSLFFIEIQGNIENVDIGSGVWHKYTSIKKIKLPINKKEKI
jgi:hypothetical protein